jgi:formate hydrogenlyase subunit 3/multisubunit Na+/H+ antiporter MnhD subunit
MDRRVDPSPRDPSAESTGDLIRRLLADVAALLATYGREIQAHLEGLGRDVAAAALMVGAALILGIFALGVAVAALILVVSIWLPEWLAALIVLGVLIASIGVLILLGTRRVRRRRALWRARVAEEMRWLRSLFLRES